jgi:hypothetical protein
LLPKVSLSTVHETGIFWQELSRPIPSWWPALTQLLAGYPPDPLFRFADVDLWINQLKNSARQSCWHSIAGAPSEGSGWRLLSHIKEFALAPDSAHLADVLDKFARDWDGPTASLLADLSPWPLAACLRSSRTAADAENLAVRAERGELGNGRHWLRAEERWARGIKLHDAMVSDEHQDLPGPHLDEAGFCFGSARLAGIRNEGEDAGKSLFELHSQIRTPSLKRTITEMVENVMLSRCFKGPGNKPLQWPNLESLAAILGVTGRPISLDMLRSFMGVNEANPLLIDVLETVGRNRTLWVSRSIMNYSLYESICRAWTQRPHLEGLLPVLATCVTGGESCSFMVEALASHKCSEPRFGAAALVLQIAHSGPDANECDASASKFVEFIADERFEAVQAAAALASKGKVKQTVVANFLLALYRHLAISDWERRNVVMSGLDDIVRRRRSRLDELEVQRTLKIEFLSDARAK